MFVAFLALFRSALVSGMYHAGTYMCAHECDCGRVPRAARTQGWGPFFGGARSANVVAHVLEAAFFVCVGLVQVTRSVNAAALPVVALPGVCTLSCVCEILSHGSCRDFVVIVARLCLWVFPRRLVAAVLVLYT